MLRLERNRLAAVSSVRIEKNALKLALAFRPLETFRVEIMRERKREKESLNGEDVKVTR